MKTTARLAHESLRFDQPASTHLVVSLTAPPVDATAKRPPVCVIPVIDSSGSMQGEKLFRAKQSVLKLVDHLAPGDPTCDACQPPRARCQACGALHADPEGPFCSLACALAGVRARRAAGGDMEPQGHGPD